MYFYQNFLNQKLSSSQTVVNYHNSSQSSKSEGFRFDTIFQSEETDNHASLICQGNYQLHDVYYDYGKHHLYCTMKNTLKDLYYMSIINDRDQKVHFLNTLQDHQFAVYINDGEVNLTLTTIDKQLSIDSESYTIASYAVFDSNVLLGAN